MVYLILLKGLFLWFIWVKSCESVFILFRCVCKRMVWFFVILVKIKCKYNCKFIFKNNLKN